MKPLVLEFPVYSLDRELLLPPGAVLDEATMEGVAASGRRQTWAAGTLLGHGTVRDDLRRFLHLDPYGEIFVDSSEVEEIVGAMESVRLPLPVLWSLDFFQEHDSYTYHHILMVSALSCLLARELLPSGEERLTQALASPTHDCGKTCVPLKILKKQAPLTRSELSLLRHHTAAGYVQMAYYHGDHRAFPALVARDHHERRTGSGYPRGARELDPLVEIIAACDVFDALISPRPYRSETFDRRTALEEIIRLARIGEMSWDTARVLVALNRKDRPHYQEVVISLETRGTPPATNCHGKLAEERAETRPSIAGQPGKQPLPA